MELTKKKAIEEHRKMWNWIADELEKPETRNKKETVHDLKVRYRNANYLDLFEDCWCCEYDTQNIDKQMYEHMRCKNCPLTWGTECDTDAYYCESGKDGGLWWNANQLSRDGEYEGASKLARQIANLPEKPEESEE